MEFVNLKPMECCYLVMIWVFYTYVYLYIAYPKAKRE